MKKLYKIIVVLMLLITMIFSGCQESRTTSNNKMDLEEAYNTYRPADIEIITKGRIFDFSSTVEPDGSIKNMTTISYDLTIINNDTKNAEEITISIGSIDDDLKIWAFEIGVKYENMKMKLLFTDDGFMKTGDAYFGDIPSNGTTTIFIYATTFETEPGSFDDNQSYNMRLKVIQEYPSVHMGGEILKYKSEIISYKVRT